MQDNTLKTELKGDGYSKEEQYFYELDRKLKKNLKEEQVITPKDPLVSPKEDAPTKDKRLKERAIQRWETDGGLIAKK